ncbi:unnamed protein product, partial [Closterium sp. NIES-53]
DVKFDESVRFYRLFPYHSAPPPPPPIFLARGPPLVDPLPPQGPAHSEPRGGEPAGVECGGAKRVGVESRGAESRGAEPRGTASSGLPRVLRHDCHPGRSLFTRSSFASGLLGAHAFRVELPALETPPLATLKLKVLELLLELVVPEVLQLLVLEVLIQGVLELPGLVVLGALELKTLRGLEQLELEELELQELELLTLALEVLELRELCMVVLVLEELCGRDRTSFPCFCRFLMSHLLLAILLPYNVHRLDSHSRCYSQPPHCLLLLLTQHVPLPAPPKSSLPAVPYPESHGALAASPTVSRLLATVVTNPSFESTAASAFVAELVDFAAACHLEYATALVAASEFASPPSVEGECALCTDVLEDRQEDFKCLAAARQTAMDAGMASWKSTGTCVNARPLSRANIVDVMWIFRVKRPPGSPPASKARYAARGFSQRQGVVYFQTFSPTLKMTTLRVLLHVAAQRDYELDSGIQYSFLAGHPAQGDLATPPSWLHWVISCRTTLAALGFTPSIADPSLFLRTDTSLSPFYTSYTSTTSSLPLLTVLQRYGFLFSSPQPTPLSSGHSLSAPPSDESVEPSGPYPQLVGCLITSGMGLVLGGRGPVFVTGQADAFWVDESATQRLSEGYTFSLGSGSVSWQSTRSSLVLSSSCEAKIYTGAMAAQELRWLTYLLTDLGEQPRSSPGEQGSRGGARGSREDGRAAMGGARGSRGYRRAARGGAQGCRGCKESSRGGLQGLGATGGPQGAARGAARATGGPQGAARGAAGAA